ncbi:glycosyl hydrolase family 28-related protein [Paenibacillus glycinis]|uniref:Rhamnogalacturonase A/B/Epimerase-like pectate lyase domain-containing protein n=1 Tax=Paenibacillus glycinis TaxID=2697035 RepID=A0ABW9XNI4_9BACL|nr:glycosyl hydrolase family 28-related protein [Paenibacillus glycinis]NBD24199.1 hypothetical protein [Paenibacillus glycinis]
MYDAVGRRAPVRAGTQEINNYPDAVNVLDVGAKGDGVADDTKAIQAAINMAAARKQIVYLPMGTYLIDPSTPLLLSSDTKLYGDGKESKLLAKPGEFGWTLVYLSGKRIDVRDLTFDGNRLVNRVLVLKAGSASVNVKNAVVTGATQSDEASSQFYGQTVSGITVYGNTESIVFDQLEVTDIHAKHGTTGSPVARGIAITSTWGAKETVAKQVTIKDSYIHDVGPADNGDCIYYEDLNRATGQAAETGSQIVNNRFYQCAKRAINLLANGITVQENDIQNSYTGNNYYVGKNAGKAAPDMYAGISIHADNVTIQDNSLVGEGSYYAGIEIGSYDKVKNATVVGNKIVMGKKSDLTDKTAIRIGNADTYKVDSNQLENGAKGIWTWLSTKNGSISNNYIIMPAGGGIELSTYLKDHHQTNVNCSNNQIKAYSYAVHNSSENVQITLLGNK